MDEGRASSGVSSIIQLIAALAQDFMASTMTEMTAGTHVGWKPSSQAACEAPCCLLQACPEQRPISREAGYTGAVARLRMKEVPALVGGGLSTVTPPREEQGWNLFSPRVCVMTKNRFFINDSLGLYIQDMGVATTKVMYLGRDEKLFVCIREFYLSNILSTVVAGALDVWKGCLSWERDSWRSGSCLSKSSELGPTRESKQST